MTGILYGTELLGTHMFNTLLLHEVPQSSGKHACAVGKSSSRLAEFPGKRLHGKIFISPGRHPASFHREPFAPFSPGNL